MHGCLLIAAWLQHPPIDRPKIPYQWLTSISNSSMFSCTAASNVSCIPATLCLTRLDHVTHNILRQYYIIVGLTCETLVFAGGILLDVDSNVCVDPKHCGSCTFKALT
jgi:hypothetical protein